MSDLQLSLVVVRGIHFAATALVAGALLFRTVVAEPALIAVEASASITSVVTSQTLRSAWVGLAIAAVSGVTWLLLEAVSMSGLPFREAMTWSVLSTVLNETQFGLVSEIRFVLAITLMAGLAFDRILLLRRTSVGAALASIAAIAWTGHGGATPGEMGTLHLTADLLHLVAASAWIGGVLSLTLLLASARRHLSIKWTWLTWISVRRFSTLGIISVSTLLAAGTVNAWILVGSIRALLFTEYGQLLALKLVIFGLMLTFAAINRFCLTPRLAPSTGMVGPEAIRQLTRNSAIEFALGLAIFAIVGLIGTMHPAIHTISSI